jgi:hypothetical protein
MDSSNDPREAEHLLDDQPVELAAATQDELSLAREQLLEQPEQIVEEASPRSDLQYTFLAATEPSDVPSTLASPTSTLTAEKDHTPAVAKQRMVLPPWTLRKAPLLGYITFLITLLVIMETLYFLSNKYQGLMTSGKNDYYLWKYCPTAGKWILDYGRTNNLTSKVMSFVAVYWSNLEYHIKISTPWIAMSQEPRPAASSLLLDYITPNVFVVIWKSARIRHFPVLTAAVGTLAIVFSTVTSTSLFTLQSTEVDRDMTMSITRSFNTTGSDLSSVDALSVLLVSSILSGNLSVDYPPGTNEQFAVESFGTEDVVAGGYTTQRSLIEKDN